MSSSSQSSDSNASVHTHSTGRSSTLSPAPPTPPVMAPQPVIPCPARLLSLADFQLHFPDADIRLFFPGLPRPARDVYAEIHGIPLGEQDRTPFHTRSSFRRRHRRLLRMLPKSPSVAIFPYTIAPMKSPARKLFRKNRLKEESEKYTFTLSNMINWPLGDRTIRMAIVTSLVEDSAQTGEMHAWAFALVNKEGEDGKDVVIFESSASSTIDKGGRVRRGDMVASQVKLLKLLHDDHRIKVGKVWWGGSQEAAWVDVADACLESSLRFIERFSVQADKEGGRVSEDMLKRWGMVLVSGK